MLRWVLVRPHTRKLLMCAHCILPLAPGTRETGRLSLVQGPGQGRRNVLVICHSSPIINRYTVPQSQGMIASLALSMPSITLCTVTRRSYRSFCLERLQYDLAVLDWQAVVDSCDLDSKVMILTDAITSAYDTHVPFRTFVVKRERCSWITPSIKRLIN